MERKRLVLYTLLIYIALIILALPANAARQNEKQNYFDRWRNVSSKELMQRAYNDITKGGNTDSALIFYNVVYNRYVYDPDDNDKKKYAASALNDMGYLMTFVYFDYERAYSYLSQALDLSQQIGDVQNLPYVYVNIGNVIFTERAYVNPAGMKDALPYYRKGFYLAARLKDWNIMLVNFTNMLGVANGLDTSIPLDSVVKDVDYFNKLKIPANATMLDYARQDVLVFNAIRAGHYEEALKLCETAISKISSGPDSLRFVLNSRVEQASCYVHLGRYQEALNLLSSQLEKARTAGIKDLETEFYLDLMIVSRKMGNKQLAEHYEYLYLKLKDDMLFGSHKIANVEQARLMRQLSKANEEVKESARKRHHTMVVAIVALAFVIIITGFTIVVVRKNRRLRESNHSLYLQVQNAVKEEEKYKNSNLDDKRRNEIVEKIESVLADKDQLCSEDMSLKYLAELTDVPYKLVSQTINEHWQKNFSQLLAEYRIHEACRRMQNKEVYGNYTIEGIGSSVGFRTRSNFVTTFKRITGLTPSEYLREAK